MLGEFNGIEPVMKLIGRLLLNPLLRLVRVVVVVVVVIPTRLRAWLDAFTRLMSFCNKV